MTRLFEHIERVRADARTRWTAFALAAVVGVAVGWVHWFGFFLGGALVGLFTRDLKRAALLGFAFGIVAWLTFAVWLALNGVFETYLAMGQILAVSAVIPVIGGVIGSLVRGLV